jgi:hypothetical protein
MLSEVTMARCVIYIPIRQAVCVCDMLVHIPPLGNGDQSPSIALFYSFFLIVVQSSVINRGCEDSWGSASCA